MAELSVPSIPEQNFEAMSNEPGIALTGNINMVISEVEKLNPELAQTLRKYVKTHAYGLVFERNLPEKVRLWTKPPQRGDSVNILPPRGTVFVSNKKIALDNEESKKVWNVVDIISEDSGKLAVLTDGIETRTVPYGEIVTVIGYSDVIYPGLKIIDKVERGNPDDPYHMVINAENYHALEALAYAYAGKVDCIYIDPPYNTGAKDWKYNNDYVGEDDKYRHSKWLAFMERRLKLAKQLLNPEDSVMIVTIDEKEYLRLGMLLEQMFPEAKIQMISSVIKPSGNPRDGGFDRCDEYLYVVMFGSARPSKTSSDMLSNVTSGKTSKLDVTWRSLLRGSGNHYKRQERPGLFYPIIIDNKDGKTIIDVGSPLPKNVSISSHPLNYDDAVICWPINQKGEESCWNLKPETLKKALLNGWVRVSDNGTIQYLNKGLLDNISDGCWTL